MFGLALLPIKTFAVACTNNVTFLGVLRPWYAYLKLKQVTLSDGSTVCQVTSFTGNATDLGNHSPVLLIGLAILDDLIRLAALVAVGYVIYGGIQYATSQGSPDATNKAQSTIINALVGVVIAILASAIVAFIGNRLGS